MILAGGMLLGPDEAGVAEAVVRTCPPRGLEGGQAYTLVQGLENLAVDILIARFESTLDSTRWLLVVLVAIFGTTMLGLAARIFYLIFGQ